MSEHEVHDVAFKDADGVISDGDATLYFMVVQQAWNIHLDKERIRHGLWQEYPAQDQANQIKIKIDRVLRSLERIAHLEEIPSEKELLEELKANVCEEMHDIINYAVFTVRQL